MPKCGNCKNHHPTVDDVRACYNGNHPVGRQSKFTEDGLHEVTEPEWPASEKQITYVLGLYDERDLPDGHERKSSDRLRLMERDEVSAEINLLKTYPRTQRSDNGKPRREWTMPAGKYALQWEGEGWFFYQVDKPTKGKWKGYTFIKRLIGAPGQYRKIDLRRGDRDEALEAIEEDPKEAMADYGLQSGRCGKCSSPLTDPESLALGIGPVCRRKMGW